jgi:two-component system chemotaxis response regulator CheB
MDVPAAVVIAQHVMSRTLLPEILAANTRMPIVLAYSGVTLQSHTIYVCPSQRHVIVNPDATLTVSGRERVSFFRPSGDWLFESAAASFQERAVGIVLSGLRHDGARGAVSIRASGGTVIVQDPRTCQRPEMPTAAIATGSVDFVLPPDQISAVVMALLKQMDLQRSWIDWDRGFAAEAV